MFFSVGVGAAGAIMAFAPARKEEGEPPLAFFEKRMGTLKLTQRGPWICA
jgi:hypothetical protein